MVCVWVVCSVIGIHSAPMQGDNCNGCAFRWALLCSFWFCMAALINWRRANAAHMRMKTLKRWFAFDGMVDLFSLIAQPRRCNRKPVVGRCCMIHADNWTSSCNSFVLWIEIEKKYTWKKRRTNITMKAERTGDGYREIQTDNAAHMCLMYIPHGKTLIVLQNSNIPFRSYGYDRTRNKNKHDKRIFAHFMIATFSC